MYIYASTPKSRISMISLMASYADAFLQKRLKQESMEIIEVIQK